MKVKTDDYPAETGWALFNDCSSTIEESRNLDMSNPYAVNTDYSEKYCVPQAEYIFTIYDQFGDGVCCGYGSGGYSVELGPDNDVVAQGGQFAFVESTKFGSCPSQPNNNPTPVVSC